MKNKQTKQTKPLCLENCKGFILNHSLAELKSSCQGLAILVAILRIVRRKLANSSSSLWVCARVRMLRGCCRLGDRRNTKGPCVHPVHLRGGSDGSTVSVQDPWN